MYCRYTKLCIIQNITSGCRCLVRGLRIFCVQRSPGICSCQLCLKVRIKCFIQLYRIYYKLLQQTQTLLKLKLLFDLFTVLCRSDAQRAAKQKERKEKELELCAFNAEQIEDSHHTHSLVSTVLLKILQHFIPLQLPFWSIHFILLKSITNLLLETRTLWGKGSKDSGKKFTFK